jgi:hypothetical protein
MNATQGGKNVTDYEEFLRTKAIVNHFPGINVDLDAISDVLYPFQRSIVQWALHKGMAAIFADCGLGKTLMQLEWARLVGEHWAINHPADALPVLIIAPLSVGCRPQDVARYREEHGIPSPPAREEKWPSDDELRRQNEAAAEEREAEVRLYPLRSSAWWVDGRLGVDDDAED